MPFPALSHHNSSGGGGALNPASFVKYLWRFKSAPPSVLPVVLARCGGGPGARAATQPGGGPGGAGGGGGASWSFLVAAAWGSLASGGGGGGARVPPMVGLGFGIGGSPYPGLLSVSLEWTISLVAVVLELPVAAL